MNYVCEVCLLQIITIICYNTDHNGYNQIYKSYLTLTKDVFMLVYVYHAIMSHHNP